MKTHLLTFACFVVLALASGADAGTATVLFEKGNRAYQEGQYREALEFYLEAETQTEGFAINYNLGNAYYKLNKIPESILHYERALKFEPNHPDALHNLRLATDKIADRIESIPRSAFSLWWEGMVQRPTPDFWGWLSIGAFACSAALLFLFLLSSGPGAKRLGFFGALLLAAMGLTMHQFGRSAFNHRYTETTAIIFTPKVDVKSEPREQAVNVFVLHAGSKVSLVRKAEDWYEIEIASGSKGWLRADDLVEI
jgi:tetratricopeptide (TPR) repeat protein